MEPMAAQDQRHSSSSEATRQLSVLTHVQACVVETQPSGSSSNLRLSVMAPGHQPMQLKAWETFCLFQLPYPPPAWPRLPLSSLTPEHIPPAQVHENGDLLFPDPHFTHSFSQQKCSVCSFIYSRMSSRCCQ